MTTVVLVRGLSGGHIRVRPYAEAGIALFWRLETEPDLVLHPFVLTGGGYEPPPVHERRSAPVPWGALSLDLTTLGA